jgi:hypothetical protein
MLIVLKLSEMNLQLSLKKKWFEMTKQGIKTEDYREITPYWEKRLLIQNKDIDWSLSAKQITIICDNFNKKENKPNFKEFTQNTMTLGYPKSTDSERILKLEHKGIEIGYGNPEWGAEPNKLYFIIKHGKQL